MHIPDTDPTTVAANQIERISERGRNPFPFNNRREPTCRLLREVAVSKRPLRRQMMNDIELNKKKLLSQLFF
jgi:hypothetical protein